MLKIKTLLSVAIAVSGVALASSCFGQGCDSCAQAAQFAPTQLQYSPAPQIQVAAPCSTCGPAPAPVVQQVAFVAPPAPAVGCASGGCGGGCRGGGCLGRGLGGGGGAAGLVDELKAKCAHQKAINARIEARNAAWPKPFDCADRQLYFTFWEPMIDRGWEEQCVLTAAHFNAETNQLNKFGQQAVAGIMQNNPSNRRIVYINRDVNESINQIRQSAVQDTINTFYGQTTNAQVAFSNKRPNTTSGDRGHQIQQQWLSNQAIPSIAVGTGGSVATEVGSGGN